MRTRKRSERIYLKKTKPPRKKNKTLGFWVFLLLLDAWGALALLLEIFWSLVVIAFKVSLVKCWYHSHSDDTKLLQAWSLVFELTRSDLLDFFFVCGRQFQGDLSHIIERSDVSHQDFRPKYLISSRTIVECLLASLAVLKYQIVIKS